MANTFSPNGFVPVRRLDGAAWSANITNYKIAHNNGNSFYQGDPVVLLGTGYINTASAGTNAIQILGIFIGCERLSTASGSKVWSNRFTGDANADVDAWVIDDPWVVFRVWFGSGASSVGGGPGTQSFIGQSFGYQYGTPSSFSGISGAYIDQGTLATSGTTGSFIMTGTVTAPPGVNGTDVTTAGNQVEVMMNNTVLKGGAVAS